MTVQAYRVQRPSEDGSLTEFIAAKPDTLEREVFTRALGAMASIAQAGRVLAFGDGWLARELPTEKPSHPLMTAEHLLVQAYPNVEITDVRHKSRQELAETFGEWALTEV